MGVFLCEWERKLNQIRPPPPEHYLERWLISKLKESPRLENLVNNYTTNAIANQNNRSYHILWKLVQSFLVNIRLDRTQAKLEYAAKNPRDSKHRDYPSRLDQ